VPLKFLVGTLRGTAPAIGNGKDWTMRTDETLLTRMKTAGVPFEDSHWFYTVARPRRFKGEGDAKRAQRILRQVATAYAPSSARQH